MPKQRTKPVSIGQVFGRLTVLAFSHVDRHGAYWLCRCGCGAEKLVRNYDLGAVKSCGCLRRSKSGLSRHPLFSVWFHMLNRCVNPKCRAYPRYGGRGIYVCERWLDVRLFIVDMGPRPTPQHQIERRDNDGPYGPENCYWATAKQQARNRRSTRLLTFNGKTQCLLDWAAEVGMKREAIAARLNKGWSVESALTTPIRRPVSG